jgi:hypothetical protein
LNFMDAILGFPSLYTCLCRYERSLYATGSMRFLDGNLILVGRTIQGALSAVPGRRSKTFTGSNYKTAKPKK